MVGSAFCHSVEEKVIGLAKFTILVAIANTMTTFSNGVFLRSRKWWVGCRTQKHNFFYLGQPVR